MNKYIKVLMIEDYEYDAKLVSIELNKNYTTEVHIVEDEESLIHEIESFSPDIILSDYNLPRFNGMKALAVRQKLCPRTPFILITGSINEETAVEAIKAGADDYILKENLKRLIPAINSAIEKQENIKQKEIVEEKLKTLSLSVEQSPVSVIITNAEGNIEFVNPKFCEVTGYSEEEVLGENPRILKSGETTSGKYADLWKTVLSGKAWLGEFHNKKKNGELFWERAAISPLVKDGVISHIVAVKEDITERKAMLQDLISAKEKAEELSRLKSHFIANMSHELRTPLVGLLGISEFLKTELEGKNRENAEVIYTSGLRLLKTITEILTFSQLESEKPVINKTDVDISKMITYQVTHQVNINRKNIEIEFDLPKEPLIFYTDPKILNQILEHVITNAFKFTDKGKITISANKNNVGLVIQIKDTGIGIPSEKLEQIFEDFRQVSEGIGRNFEGMGIGLTIAKRYSNLLKGEIKVESKPGVGSVFTFIFPDENVGNVTKDPEAKSTFTRSAMNPDINVLIVEDDFINALTIKKMLEKRFRIFEAHNGPKAIDVVKKEAIDVILMDINLRQSIDGVETTKIIRNMEGYNKTPIIAMTAYALPSDKEAFLKSGFSHYIAKPFAYEDLQQMLDEIFNGNKLN